MTDARLLPSITPLGGPTITNHDKKGGFTGHDRIQRAICVLYVRQSSVQSADTCPRHCAVYQTAHGVLVTRRWNRPIQCFPVIWVAPTAAPAQAGETAIPHRHRCTGSAHTAPGPVCCRHALPDLSSQGRFHRRVTTATIPILEPSHLPHISANGSSLLEPEQPLLTSRLGTQRHGPHDQGNGGSEDLHSITLQKGERRPEAPPKGPIW